MYTEKMLMAVQVDPITYAREMSEAITKVVLSLGSPDFTVFNDSRDIVWDFVCDALEDILTKSKDLKKK